MSEEPNTSVNWNGVTFTAFANKGARYGEATGDTPETATKAALSTLTRSPDRQVPETGATGPVPPPEVVKTK